MPTREAYSQEIDSWFEAETWRVGGPRAERVLDFFEGIVAGGRIEAVLEANRHIYQLLAHRWLDGNLLWRFVPAIAKVNRRGTDYEYNEVSEVFRQQLVLATMSDDDRLQLYRRALEEETVWFDVGGGHSTRVGWDNAAMAALWEHLDELVPDIEAAVAAHKDRAEKVTLVPYIEGVLLPLAQVRRTENWLDGYMELIRGAVTSQANSPDTNPASIRNLLLREALLELVHKNQTGVTAQLISLYEGPQDNSDGSAESGRAGASSVVSAPKRPRTGPAAEYLARAVRAFGTPGLLPGLASSSRLGEAEAAERALIRGGYMKRQVTTQDAGPR